MIEYCYLCEYFVKWYTCKNPNMSRYDIYFKEDGGWTCRQFTPQKRVAIMIRNCNNCEHGYKQLCCEVHASIADMRFSNDGDWYCSKFKERNDNGK